MIHSDTIPTCIGLAEALLLHQKKVKGLLEADLATAPPTSAPSQDPENFFPLAARSTKRSRKIERMKQANPSVSTGTLNSYASKRLTNAGHQMSDADIETMYDKEWESLTARFKSPKDSEGSNESRPIHNGISSASDFSSNPPPLINGHSSGISRSLTPPLAQNGSDHGTIPSQSRYPDSHSRSRSPTPPFHAQNDPAWTGQFTGPASGFLHGSVVPFARANQNPGRTIYSQSTSERPE